MLILKLLNIYFFGFIFIFYNQNNAYTEITYTNPYAKSTQYSKHNVEKFISSKKLIGLFNSILCIPGFSSCDLIFKPFSNQHHDYVPLYSSYNLNGYLAFKILKKYENFNVSSDTPVIIKINRTVNFFGYEGKNSKKPVCYYLDTVVSIDYYNDRGRKK
jgi:hypothetical protein